MRLRLIFNETIGQVGKPRICLLISSYKYQKKYFFKCKKGKKRKPYHVTKRIFTGKEGAELGGGDRKY